MKKLPSLADGPGTSFRRSAAESFIVRSPKRAEPFEIDSTLIDGGIYVPIDTPIYVGDLVERKDPRGGVMEYGVENVEINRDPFGRSNDYAVAHVCEKGHIDRKFGTINVTISGGNNQVSFGDGGSQSQEIGIDAVALLEVLRAVLSGAPSELSEDDILEVREAVEAAAGSVADSQPPRVVKRALLGLKGVVEQVAGSVRSGANAEVAAWAKSAVHTLLEQIAGLS